MAILTELGKKYPCSTQGYAIPTDDTESFMEAGDVVEAQWVADRDISTAAAFDLLIEVLKIKEEYPDFVLHYIKVESRRISVQYSIAPVGASHSPAVAALIWLVVKAIGILIGIALVGYVIYTLIDRQYWLAAKKPTGTAVITAKHTETDKAISDVLIYVDGNEVGRTDGGSIEVTDLPVGEHKFAGETLEGFHKPASITETIVKDQVHDITVWYRPEGIPDPTTGFLHVYTDPVQGMVYIDTVEIGLAPVSEEVDKGDHTISFGSVEGYITPDTQTVTVVAGQTKEITGKYRKPDEDEVWYEKYLKYALIGGGAILGASLLVPELIRALRRRGRE